VRERCMHHILLTSFPLAWTSSLGMCLAGQTARKASRWNASAHFLQCF